MIPHCMTYIQRQFSRKETGREAGSKDVVDGGNKVVFCGRISEPHHLSVVVTETLSGLFNTVGVVCAPQARLHFLLRCTHYLNIRKT